MKSIDLSDRDSLRLLHIPGRVINALVRADIYCIQDLMRYMAKHPGSLLLIKNIGKLGAQQILLGLYQLNCIKVWEPDHSEISS